ncbi:MAG: Crp/Fnr family transcriptional regulator [Steroidobacteraceae bacterium]
MPILTNITPKPTQNRLLAALPAAMYARLAPDLELVPMRLGETLYQSGSQMPYVYFPTTAIVSLLYFLKSGSCTEVASVGNEGMLGITLAIGGDSTLNTAVVQTAGHAYRLKAIALKNEIKKHSMILNLLLRYAQVLLAQIAQTGACNRHHSIEQQLCRWLLMTLDRLPCDDLVLTQDLVATTLGVRRESITEAAGNLQRAGLIRYRRGHIAVSDRSGLETHVCECYAVVRREMGGSLDTSYRQIVANAAA